MLQFKTKPYGHQLKWLEDTKDLEYYAIFGEPGTGKSKYALDLAVYLFLEGKITQVLIITKNGVDTQFIEEAVPDHLALSEDKYFAEGWKDGYGWKLFNKQKQFLKEKLVVVATNCEALATKRGEKACRELALNGPTLLIIDESQEFANLFSKRSKNLLRFVNTFPYRRIMTGTPSGGNPFHIYSQFQILSEKIFPMSKWGFEARYCTKEQGSCWVHKRDKKSGAHIKYERKFDTIVGYKNLDELQEIVSKHSSRVLKKDCLDLPEKVYKKTTFILSDEERTLYDRLKNAVLTEISPGKYVTTELAITKLIRLQQVACGFVSFEDLVTGERSKQYLPNPSRLKALEDWAVNVNGKALIWATFTTSIDQIIEKLKEGYPEESIVRYDGTVGPNQKQINKIAFKTQEKVRWLVGHPKAGGVGLDLPEASNTCYYSNDYHLISRLQSEDRNHRIGSKQCVTYTDLVALKTVDNRIRNALRSNFDIASKLTGDLLREWLE